MKSGHFVRKFQAFRDKDTNPNQKGETHPKNQPLVASIEDVRAAFLDAFWTDDPRLMPGNVKQWVEIWLSTNSVDSIAAFRDVLNQLQIEEHPEHPEISFPDRTVLMVRTNRQGLLNLVEHSDELAELRAGREPCSFFADLDNAEQADWAKDLLSRLDVDPDSKVSVCILDSGVNRGHPIIEPLMAQADAQAVDQNWGTADNGSHGTLMAGLGGYGDLQASLLSSEPVKGRHRLESVKILPPPPNSNPRHLWGHVTKQGVARAEIQAPNRNRVVCLAVTSRDTKSAGKPTSWSGSIDQLAEGDGGPNRRLILVSAGNTDETNYPSYPASNMTDEVQDPAQAWNALTVGGMTNLVQITHKSYKGFGPLAPVGALAPCGCTSVAWDRVWPIKPEVVFEGGNEAINGQGSVQSPDELKVLSTWADFTKNHFAPFSGTSASTAQAAWFAAQLWAEYPRAWPETIRCLMVHSATWTDGMLALRTGIGKSSYEPVLRSVGYGIPNLDRALRCLANRLTLVVEQTLRPFAKRAGGNIGTNDIHLHSLPWPVEALQELGETEVTMKITLSYFIEPGPGEIGWKDKYRYPSHGLRFDLNSPGESKDEFMKRINVAARLEDEEKPATPSSADHWKLGSNLRDKGSIHSDIWEGRAADLAASRMIAVFPTVGWWKEREKQARWNSDARYSLVVSIQSPVEEVDLYTPILAEVQIPIAVEIERPDE